MRHAAISHSRVGTRDLEFLRIYGNGVDDPAVPNGDAPASRAFTSRARRYVGPTIGNISKNIVIRNGRHSQIHRVSDSGAAEGQIARAEQQNAPPRDRNSRRMGG